MSESELDQRIIEQFVNSIESAQQTVSELTPYIEEACSAIVETLLADGKIMTCGNGLAGLEAQRLATVLVNRFERDRPSLPAFSLTTDTITHTAIASTYQFNQVYAKQLEALGNSNDTLVIFSVSGRSANLVNAVTTAHDKGMRVIALTARDGGNVASVLTDSDIELRVPHDRAPLIHESYHMLVNCFASNVDHLLFGFDEDY